MNCFGVSVIQASLRYKKGHNSLDISFTHSSIIIYNRTGNMDNMDNSPIPENTPREVHILNEYWQYYWTLDISSILTTNEMNK